MAKALLRVVTDYAYAVDLLDDYDHQRIRLGQVRKGEFKGVSYSEAMQIIDQLRTAYGASPLFGKEKDAQRLILTGSQNFSLMQGFSESLAGRCSILNMLNLSFRELKENERF